METENRKWRFGQALVILRNRQVLRANGKIFWVKIVGGDHLFFTAFGSFSPSKISRHSPNFSRHNVEDVLLGHLYGNRETLVGWYGGHL